MYDFSPGGGGDNGFAVLQLQDSNYVICGLRYDSTEGAADTYLLKLNTSGEIIWNKQIDGGFNDWSYDFKYTKDNGFIITGYNYDSTFSSSKISLIKTDSLGNMLWQKLFGGASYDYAYSIDIASDGGYIIGGKTYSFGAGGSDLFLLKTDSTGDSLWLKTFGTIANDWFGNAVTTLDGGFILSGRLGQDQNGKDAYLVKTDSTGNIEWEGFYGRGSGLDRFYAVRQLPDSSYIAGGTTRDYNESPWKPRGWLIKLNSNGDSLWSKTYTYYGGQTDDYVEDINITNDGGFIICGYVVNNSLPSKNDLWLVKTDSMGCVDTSCLITGISGLPIINVHQPIIQIQPNPFVQKTTISVKNIETSVYKETLTLKLYDVLGKQIKVSYTLQIINKDSLTIKLQKGDLKSGLYFFKITNEVKTFATGKLMVK